MPRKPRRRTNVVEMFGRSMVAKRKPKRGRFSWGAARLFLLTLLLVFVAGISATNWHKIADRLPDSVNANEIADETPMKAKWQKATDPAPPMATSQNIAVKAPASPASADLICNNPYVIDGDTIDCGGERVRLASIDAPEMPGHCRQGRDCTPGDPNAARDELSRLVQHPVSCRSKDTDSYGRTIATCVAGGVDLSCAMVASGHAVQRYGMLSC